MAARTSTEQRLPRVVPRSGTVATGSTAAQRRSRDAKVAGVLLSLAGAAILMGFITAEALYPGLYTTHTNTVSTALLGVGTLGVGVFPLTHPTPHTLFAFTAFLAGGIAVVLSSRVTTAPFRYVWMVLGAVSLVATVLGLFFLEWAPVAELGEGGIERWIVYPIVLWLVAFGSCLMATPATRSPHDGSRSV